MTENLQLWWVCSCTIPVRCRQRLALVTKRSGDFVGTSFRQRNSTKQSGKQVLVLVNFRIYPRRGPKKLRFILSNQKELRTRTENEMFSSFKTWRPPTRNLQAISLLPSMIWYYQRAVWLLEILKFMRYC